MITVYSYLDQYQVISLNTYPTWHGIHEAIISVTPDSRTTIIGQEDRTTIIGQEDRTTIIT